MGRYFIETYGCQMNLADTETIRGILEGAGWSGVVKADEADLIIVNTCSVREKAAKRAIGRLQSMAALKKTNRDLIIAIAGCLPQHRGEALAEQLPDVDLFVGPDNYRQLPEMLAKEVIGEHFLLKANKEETYGDIKVKRERNVNAWISIMRGCDRLCTYCAVPLARGRERSLGADDVIVAAEEAIAAGFPAVTLLGQAVTSYQDGERDFTWLLDRLSRLEALKRIWFLSPYPTDFTNELLSVIGEKPNITRHLHLPLQAGSNRILELMRRRYLQEDFLALVESARRLIPGVMITTDLIVGFPGESDADFHETIATMKAARFDSAFMFAYSPRERTYASRFLTDDVSHEEKMVRLREVIDLQEELAWASFKSMLGETVEVLVEGDARSDPGHWFGRSRDNRPTAFSAPAGQSLSAGDLVQVLVTDVTSHTLKGELVSADQT